MYEQCSSDEPDDKMSHFLDLITLIFHVFWGSSNNSTSQSFRISSSLKVIIILFQIKANLFASTWLDSSFLNGRPNPYLSFKRRMVSLIFLFSVPWASNNYSSGIRINWIALAKKWNLNLNYDIFRISPK